MLDEYALRFYTFLEMSIKMDAQEWLDRATSAAVPYMGDNDRKETLELYRQSSRDILEDVKQSFETVGIEELREQFR